MAFGQQSGPPATQRQLKELLALLQDQGYTSFRDARGPLGFTQRQGGGKFTSAEADDLIEQLQNDPDSVGGATAEPVVTRTAAVRRPKPDASLAERRGARQTTTIRDIPAKTLARELERRGWVVFPPAADTVPDPTEAPDP